MTEDIALDVVYGSVNFCSLYIPLFLGVKLFHQMARIGPAFPFSAMFFGKGRFIGVPFQLFCIGLGAFGCFLA